ncbi:hypothetical protein B0J11DRAFT_528737 [Dendryphion nanum]|uniref:Uncharacterized protein n=1 Tax=Dendryphion nanum TaxID=256645 RepID=A0A9P9DV46_9PLEO|nr:hypothetical protein B0J11DRAFT_528737 [Dendryphion nanum]
MARYVRIAFFVLFHSKRLASFLAYRLLARTLDAASPAHSTTPSNAAAATRSTALRPRSCIQHETLKPQRRKKTGLNGGKINAHTNIADPQTKHTRTHSRGMPRARKQIGKPK